MATEPHPFIPNADARIVEQMLRDVGVRSVQDLFDDMPADVRSHLNLSSLTGMSEMQTYRYVTDILNKNRSADEIISFLGAGVWHHYVPACVDALISRGEYLTSYTPYQPEISQGILQTLFEYQSLMSELTAMDYINSSMYDWSTALGEAARMAERVTHRKELLIPHYIHPERLATLRSYCESADMKIRQLGQDKRTGALDLRALKESLGGQTAAVYIEYPSFLGFVEEQCDEIGRLAHDAGALYMVGIEPTSLGVLKPPGEFGADIVVGEGQPLGGHMNFGGPLLGIFACKGDEVLRQMPGRMVGVTRTLEGDQQAFCMALQTREQHIRREKATSNICTNEALMALAASIYLCLLGPRGIVNLCSKIITNTKYAIERLRSIDGVRAPSFDAFHLMEFSVNFDGSRKTVAEINRRLLEVRIQGGLDLSGYFPELGQSALYCFTEVHSKETIDMLCDRLQRIIMG